MLFSKIATLLMIAIVFRVVLLLILAKEKVILTRRYMHVCQPLAVGISYFESDGLILRVKIKINIFNEPQQILNNLFF